MSLTFEQPWWLLLALGAIPVAWTGVRWFNTMSRARAWSAIIARVVLLTLLAAALAGAAAVRTSDRLAVVAVVDVSDSVKQFADFGTDAKGRRISASDAVLDWLDRAGASRGPDDLLGVVVFDGRSIALATPRRSGARLPTLDFHMEEGTNIERALRFGAALIPPDASGRLLLVSDGDETAGDALGAAAALASGLPSGASGAVRAGGARAGIPVDVLPVTYRVRREVLIEAVDAPPRAASESTITVRVVLNAADAAAGTIELLYEGVPLDLNGPSRPGTGRRVELKPGRNVQLIDVKLGPGVIHRLEPVFVADSESGDRFASNNRAQTFVVSPGKGAVLILDGVSRGDPAGAGALLGRTLSAAGIPATTVPPGELPGDLLSLQAYDLVMLQNVAAEELPREAHAMLAEYAREMGGGIVMIGGPDSFGAGGWKGTELEAVLPVRLDLPEQLVTPSAAVMLVLDSSGSMRAPVLGGSRSQQEIANEGAALAIETLDKGDLVGVIEFNSDYRVVVPLARNERAGQTADRVRAIAPGGGTNLYPALERAKVELLNVKASVKHVIVLTDGKSEGDPEDGVRTARAMADAGITVSTIAVGDDADLQTLAQIARAGRGQFYQVVDPKLLPRVFVKEIRVVRKPLIRLGWFAPLNVHAGSPLLRGVEGPWPELRGLVLTQPRPDPAIINALITPEGEPLLAHWYVGRGQVAAFTSDAHDDWATRWIAWPGYAAMWTQIARTIARPPGDRSLDLTTEIAGDELRIRLDAIDEQGRPIGNLSLPGFVTLPGGGRAEVALAQTGPGTYEARLPAPDRGTYVVALAPVRGTRALAPVWGGATRAVGPELARLSSDANLLRRIAEETGGRLLSFDRPEGAELWSRAGVAPRRASLPLWPALLAWSLAVFVIDVGTRRVAWDRLVSRAVMAEVREHAAAAVQQRASRAARTLSGLRRATEAAGASAGMSRAGMARGGPAAAPGTLPSRDAVRPAATGESAPVAEAPEDAAERDARTQREREAQEERRRRLRQQMLRRVAGAGGPGGSGGAGEAPPTAADAADRTSELFAAKKRVRERFGGTPRDADDGDRRE